MNEFIHNSCAAYAVIDSITWYLAQSQHLYNFLNCSQPTLLDYRNTIGLQNFYYPHPLSVSLYMHPLLSKSPLTHYVQSKGS